jgi:hypothetical protein
VLRVPLKKGFWLGFMGSVFGSVSPLYKRG